MTCLICYRFLLFYNQNAHEIEKSYLSESKAVTMARMWKSLTAEDRAAYGRIAALENTNNSNYLSEDLSGLELKPLSKPAHSFNTGLCFATLNRLTNPQYPEKVF